MIVMIFRMRCGLCDDAGRRCAEDDGISSLVELNININFAKEKTRNSQQTENDKK